MDDGWVDDRLQALRPTREWIPNAGRTLSLLQARGRAHALVVRRWLMTTFAATATACVVLLLLPASRACAQQPGACVLRVLGVDRHSPAQVTGDFKQVGSASAPVTIEVYFDYQCGHCDNFVRDVVPLLKDEYIKTGKVKLIYRDYPVPSHAYAKTASRYAYVAGELGYYETAMKQLFATQAAWSVTGDIDSQLSGVLPARVMEKLRARMMNDPEADAALAADMAAAQADHLDRTPFAVISTGGTHQPILDPTLDNLKRNLDRVTAQ